MNANWWFAGKKILVTVAVAVALLIALLNGVAASSQPVTGKLDIGEFVFFGSYEGTPVLWQVIHNDDNGSLLFSTEILTYKAFDARGDQAEGRDSKYNTRVSEGSNYWPKSNIREWLNSPDEIVNYSHQEPDAQHTLGFGGEDLSYALRYWNEHSPG